MVPRLQLKNITKKYPGVIANDNVSLAVMPGEIHAVLGENGAGKSTLMKIIYGAATADTGEILWNNAPVHINNPAVARQLGIGMVYQHFSLFESVTVAENIAVALNEPFNLPALSLRIKDLSEKYGLPIDPGRQLHYLSVGERQRVEIVRCLLQTPKLLILDEPTSVLTPQAARQLFKTLQGIANQDCSILYISHKLEEIRELCDNATILRAGKVVGSAIPQECTSAELAQMMVGASFPKTQHHKAQPANEPSLTINRLFLKSDDPFGTDLDEVSFSVHAGEIVGIAGISGNGQSELVACLSGEQTLTTSDAIQLFGQHVAHLGPGARRKRGLNFVPEERLGRGVVPTMMLHENALLTGHRKMVKNGFVKRALAHQFTNHVIKHFNVKCNGSRSIASSLSGGNLQKFIVGREIGLAPKVLIVSQPTWGVDVAAAAFIRQTLIDMSRQSTAVLIISEELDELFEICDRLMVFFDGHLSESKQTSETTIKEIGLLMAGTALKPSTAEEA